IVMQLRASHSGFIPLTEIADNLDAVDPTKLSRNDIIQVRIVEIDRPNKTFFLSVRPSRLRQSGELDIVDRHIDTLHDVKVNDIVRGFVKNVTEKGLFVGLGPTVTAVVFVSEISDSYIKDWKPLFTVDQLIKG